MFAVRITVRSHTEVHPAQVQISLFVGITALVEEMQEGARIEQDIVVHFGHEVGLGTEAAGPAQHGQSFQGEVGVGVHKTPLNQVSSLSGFLYEQLGQSRVRRHTHHEQGHDPETPHLHLSPPGVPDGLSRPLIGRSGGNHDDEVRLGALAHERTGHEQELLGSGGGHALLRDDAGLRLHHRVHPHGGDP